MSYLKSKSGYYVQNIPHPCNEDDTLTLYYETPESLYNLPYSKYINQITLQLQLSISSDFNFYIQPY